MTLLAGMAANLARLVSEHNNKQRGQPAETLLVYNRTASKAQPLTDRFGANVRVVANPAELGEQCTIVCLMLADDTACQGLLDQLTGAEQQQQQQQDGQQQHKGLQGKVIINHSTNTPEFSMRAQHQVEAAGGVYLAVPVWGR